MRFAKLLALVPLALLAAAPAPAAGRARGVFTSGELKVDVVDAYAYMGKAEFGDDQVVVVRLAAQPLDHAAIDGALDRVAAFKAQAADSPSMTLQFDPKTGAWLGSSYYLGQSQGCGYCSAPDVPGARLKLEGGALKGRLVVKASDHADGKGAGADITFDLPIAGEAKATDLGAEGGEPGRAFAACHTAVARKDTAAFRKHCALELDSLGRLEENAASGDDRARESLATFFDWGLSGMQAVKLSALRITGGRSLGAEAELLVEGKDESGTTYKGRVFMKKADAGWLWASEDLSPVF
jgi:hypothetical protein